MCTVRQFEFLFLSPEVIWAIMHDRVIIVVIVSCWFIVILVVKVSMFSLPDILLDDLDVLVPVSPGMLMVEAQCVHDLMHGPPWAAEAVTVFVRGFLQRKLLLLILASNIRPASGIKFKVISWNLGKMKLLPKSLLMRMKVNVIFSFPIPFYKLNTA